MDGAAIFHDSDLQPCITAVAAATGGGQKAKRGKFLKGDSVTVGASMKKILADITNTDQHQPQPEILPPATDVSAELHLKEIATRRKLLAHRNAVIESCKTELQKYQSNFQSLRKQNSELAFANTQMMREINSSRQRVRELQLEVASKNGVIKALKLEMMENDHRVNLTHGIDVDESKQSDQKFEQHHKGDAKRKRVSKSQSTAPAVKQLKSTEKVQPRRYSSRRNSAGLNAGKSEPTEDSYEINNDTSHLPDNLANENESTSLGSEVHDVARQDTESSGPSNTEHIIAKSNTEKKRHSLRRQSSLFKPENPDPAEDFFDIDNPKFEVSNLCDDMLETLPRSSGATSENNACALDPQPMRRTSIVRPLRRSAVKVVSYKEIPINVKMRRN